MLTEFEIVDATHTPQEYRMVAELLMRVFVEAGYTERASANRLTAPEELQRRGDIILAKSAAGEVLGMVVCMRASSPGRQVAEPGEAEMHLLAVDPQARRQGVASALIQAFEQRSRSNGFSKAVLSTQPTMAPAQRLYERHGYHRNPGRDWSGSNGKKYLVYQKNL